MRSGLLSTAAASPFAHLLGLGRGKPAAAKKADDEKDKREDARAEDEGDEKKDNDKSSKKAKADDGDDEQKKDDEGKASASAEDDDDDDDEKKDDDEPNGKSKKAADDDDRCEDDDEQMKAARADGVRAGRKLERERCEAIFLSPAAAGRPDMAAQLAFRTRMSAEEAIGVLTAAGPAARGQGLADRMSSVKSPDVGPGGDQAAGPSGATAAQRLAAECLASSKKARGEK